MKKERPRGKLSVVTADQRSSRLGAASPCVSLTREHARHHLLLLEPYRLFTRARSPAETERRGPWKYCTRAVVGLMCMPRCWWPVCEAGEERSADLLDHDGRLTEAVGLVDAGRRYARGD